MPILLDFRGTTLLPSLYELHLEWNCYASRCVKNDCLMNQQITWETKSSVICCNEWEPTLHMRQWQRMKLQADIGHFPSICGTCLHNNQCSAKLSERLRTRTNVCMCIIALQHKAWVWGYHAAILLANVRRHILSWREVNRIAKW